ncbi:hypothetical protein DYBT9275_00678 [Dyadobacter sp. CECT 9275]|uniref:Uncharacterized protein n=1 Tax=Dyadobacter helix TaxID=2822344 RepID=A0A916J7W9_9BACT|nr:hypothetical protein DYBT9275_00678 [Dyadobacter sp. CECT 9275]
MGNKLSLKTADEIRAIEVKIEINLVKNSRTSVNDFVVFEILNVVFFRFLSG